MSNLTQALDKIVNWQRVNFPEEQLSFLNSGLISLRSGLRRQQIEELTSNFPFRLTKELYELYQYSGELYLYRNRYIELTPHVSLLSFEDAIDINQGCIEIGDRKHIIDSYKENSTTTFLEKIFRKLWRQQPLSESPLITEYKFEIGYGFGKETYYVVCEEEEKDSSPVWVRFIADAPLMFSKSLTLWIAAIAEGYETGVYYIDKDGYFTVDIDKREKLLYKYNPELSETWQALFG